MGVLAHMGSCLKPGHTDPNGWIAHKSHINSDFCASFTRLHGSLMRDRCVYTVVGLCDWAFNRQLCLVRSMKSCYLLFYESEFLSSMICI